MCILIDKNVSYKIFKTPDSDSNQILKWLFKFSGKVAVSDSLFKLYRKHRKDDLRPNILTRLYQNQQLIFVDDDRITEEIQNMVSDGLPLRVNEEDYQFIALARLTNVRLLYTLDDQLSQDFTNREILNPKGKCYKNKNHANLLGPKTCTKKCKAPTE